MWWLWWWLVVVGCGWLWLWLFVVVVVIVVVVVVVVGCGGGCRVTSSLVITFPGSIGSVSRTEHVLQQDKEELRAFRTSLRH